MNEVIQERKIYRVLTDKATKEWTRVYLETSANSVLCNDGMYAEEKIGDMKGMSTIKRGVTVLNSPGTIDADYRGEICVILVNLSSEPFIIEDGERIAQMVIARHEQAEWELVDVLDETERGAGGFGHSGVK